MRSEIEHDKRLPIAQGVIVADTATNLPKKEWNRPVLRKLPVAETSTKMKGNEGGGHGKGENTIVS